MRTLYALLLLPSIAERQSIILSKTFIKLVYKYTSDRDGKILPIFTLIKDGLFHSKYIYIKIENCEVSICYIRKLNNNNSARVF